MAGIMVRDLAGPGPSVCAVCGGNLAVAGSFCDHGSMLRGEVAWVPEPGQGEVPRARWVAPEMLVLLAGVYLVSRVGSPVAPSSVVALLGVGGALCWLLVARYRAAQRQRFVVSSTAGGVEGWGELRGGRWHEGAGQGVSWAEVQAGFEARSSSGVLGQIRRPSAATLLKAALLRLASRGHLRARIERQLSWVRNGGFPLTRVLEERLEFLPASGSPGEPLPWLEEHLRLALVRLSGGVEAVAGTEQGPYRSAPSDPGEPARWVGLGELLLAFHRAEGGQPFHRAWLIERASEGGVDGGPPGEGPCQPSLSPMLTGASMQRALTEAARKRRAELRWRPPG